MFLCSWILKVLLYLDWDFINVFCKYFLPVHHSSAHSLDIVFLRTVFLFEFEFQLINYSLCKSHLWCCISRAIAILKVTRFCPVSSRSFVFYSWVCDPFWINFCAYLSYFSNFPSFQHISVINIVLLEQLQPEHPLVQSLMVMNSPRFSFSLFPLLFS